MRVDLGMEDVGGSMARFTLEIYTEGQEFMLLFRNIYLPPLICQPLIHKDD